MSFVKQHMMSDPNDMVVETSSKSYTESDLESFDNVFKITIEVELLRMLQIQDQYKSIGSRIIVKPHILGQFFQSIFTASCPKILKPTITIQQMYMLHILGISLNRFNERYLKMNKEEFITNIYLPNVMTACAKQLVEARRLIHRLVRDTYIVVEENGKDIIKFYVELHNVESSVIKNDIVYLFLRNIVTQFDPLELDNVEQLYTSLVHRMFFFYLKARTSGRMSEEMDQSFVYEGVGGYPSERYHIYEEALQLAQIQIMCMNSTAMQQISSQYVKIHSMVLPNEVQRLYLLSLSGGQHNSKNNKLVGMKTFSNIKHMTYLKNNLPIIYRILRSIHVISDVSTFTENELMKMKEAVYETLYEKYSNVLDDNVISPVIKQITDNLVNSLSTGEFIDMLSLTSVQVSSDKFIDQLQKFLQLILSDLQSTDIPLAQE